MPKASFNDEEPKRVARAERWTSLDGALSRLAKPVPEGLQIDTDSFELHHGA